MPILSVSYDLHKEPSRVYHNLEKALSAFKAWCRPTESNWFIYTEEPVTPEEVYHYLKPYLHARDKVIITPIQLNGGWWSQGLTQQTKDWLRTALTTKGKNAG